MLKVGGKTFLNLQEAVGWLLANNALPFQSTANYVADTEIAKTTIINPSPAEIKVGALVLFADSKIGTVSGLTSNGFMVGSEHTDIKNALAYISGVSVSATGYLTVTLSDGTTINAGQIKAISSFSIDASQHLIANFNNGTSQDLGAIFSGNVNISGNLTADSIIENMSGYSASIPTISGLTIENVYTGCVKNGNKVTLVVAVNLTKTVSLSGSKDIAFITVPSAIYNALNGTSIGGYANLLVYNQLNAIQNNGTIIPLKYIIDKDVGYSIAIKLQSATIDDLPLNEKTYVRIEATFLLSNSLI